MGHDHSHAAGRAQDRSRLILVLAITVSVAVIEIVGATLSGSLALIADAGHMFIDASGIVLALSASYVATLAPSKERTFGYHRAEILAALVNAVVLIGGCGFLLYSGLARLIDPPPVEARTMLYFAAGGLVANFASMAVLAARRTSSLNMRAAFLEVASDAIGSAAAAVAAVVVLTTDWLRADPLASLVIAAMILPRSWRLFTEAVGVLFEATPAGVDLDEVRATLRRVPGVLEVHDLHVWSITSGMPALSAHVVVDAATCRDSGPALDRLAACVRERWSIDHATFQIEPEAHGAHEHLGEQVHE